MKPVFLFICVSILFPCLSRAQLTPFERSKGAETATYAEIRDFYHVLDSQYQNLRIQKMGLTDEGEPLELVCMSRDGSTDPAIWQKQGKLIMLILNGIHPGEPDGIDASMMFCRDLLTGKHPWPEHVVFGIIPVYNVGGCLNRNAYSRVNQNGPNSYGFRGNAQNLDLNRDFTKCDSREALVFNQLFHYLNPDVLLDTHVSDGADFQHTMTLISTQYDKLGGGLGLWMRNSLEPALYAGMKKKNWDMIPYVDFDVSDIRKGMYSFIDAPRYSTGYASLFGCIGFMTETHMLKPFPQRVQATYDFMGTLTQTVAGSADSIRKYRQDWERDVQQTDSFTLNWKRDTTHNRPVHFMGYETDTLMSAATGLPKMVYNHQKPFTEIIPYRDRLQPVQKIATPKAYIIPRGWHTVITRLQANGVKMHALERDTILDVETYMIENVTASTQVYEKHFKNKRVQLRTVKDSLLFLAGDYWISMDQKANRYLFEMLDPRGDDSFFSWNFFDAILQPREGYSDYRWEDLAAEVLREDAELRNRLEAKKKADPDFAKDSSAILYYIYKNSKYYEPAHRRYPVFRVTAGAGK